MTCVDLYGRTFHFFNEMNMPRRGNSALNYYFPKYKEQFAQRSIVSQELCSQSMLVLKSTDASIYPMPSKSVGNRVSKIPRQYSRSSQDTKKTLSWVNGQFLYTFRIRT
uniref:Uncharacterized protein n=1 Tax=Micrurus surinamensis TaxID=129470 RepID=A0A2D4P8A6_MICSU